MRVLMVEGAQDKRVVPWLVEAAGIEWGPKNNPVVRIQDFDGADALLAPGEIETQLKASGLDALGVIVDADTSAEDRWSAVRARISDSYSTVPESLPESGLVIREVGRPSFGVWVMPDNKSYGMLETFLLHLRPEENSALLQYCEEACLRASELGAPYKQQHRDKAQIHAWLAWQDPPGRQLHNAIMERMLTRSPSGLRLFISWFRALYSL